MSVLSGTLHPYARWRCCAPRELLPWDCWGAMPEPNESISADSLRLFDRLAELTLAPEQALDELRQLGQDHRLQVPEQVYNAVRDRRETI